MEKISLPEFRNLFHVSRRAFHLELKDSYHVTDEDEPFRRFLAGEPADLGWLSSWLAHVRQVTQSGTTIQRARVISEPPNDYARFLLAVTPANIDAGEDVRYLPRHMATGITFPDEDCWLFDNSRLVLVIFHDDGRMDGFYLSENPELTSEYARTCAQVWARAVRYDQYIS